MFSPLNLVTLTGVNSTAIISNIGLTSLLLAGIVSLVFFGITKKYGFVFLGTGLLLITVVPFVDLHFPQSFSIMWLSLVYLVSPVLILVGIIFFFLSGSTRKAN